MASRLMVSPATAHKFLRVLRRHITDEAVLQTLVADLEMTMESCDAATRTLFRVVASEMREVPERMPGESHPNGRWVNKGTKSWS